MSTSINIPKTQLDQSYWAIVRRQFNKNKLAVWSLRFVYIIFFVGMFADFLANDKPIYCVYKGKSYFPIFNSYGVSLGLTKWDKDLANVNWRELEYETVVHALIPYSPENIDYNNKDYVGPFDEQNVPSAKYKHFLGTDKLGRDVLAGMIHGTRVAMLVGVISMSIAVIIGIILGSLAGYFGDSRLKMSRASIYLNLLFFVFGLYFAFGTRSYAIADALSNSMFSFFVQTMISFLILAVFMAVASVLALGFKRLPFFSKEVNVPVDILVSRLIEVFVSVPTMLLILSIVAIIKSPSIFITMVIIGFTGWTGIAKYVRAELLKVRSLEYIEAAQALGYNEIRIIFKHAIPNSLTSVLISIAFGVAGAILLESGLSFLGIGVPPEQVTWGSMLSAARGYVPAWWLAIFPGVAIFITVTLFNLLGEGLTDAMDPRLKQ